MRHHIKVMISRRECSGEYHSDFITRDFIAAKVCGSVAEAKRLKWLNCSALQAHRSGPMSRTAASSFFLPACSMRSSAA